MRIFILLFFLLQIAASESGLHVLLAQKRLEQLAKSMEGTATSGEASQCSYYTEALQQMREKNIAKAEALLRKSTNTKALERFLIMKNRMVREQRLAVQKKREQDIIASAKADAWGPLKNDLRIQIIAAQDTYVLGESMRFHVLIQNTADEGRECDYHNMAAIPRFLIRNQNGNYSRIKAGFAQTSGSFRLQGGEVTSLFLDYDVSIRYMMLNHGTYRIQFKCPEYLESNILEIEVAEGTARIEDLVLKDLYTLERVKSFKWGLMGYKTKTGASIATYVPGLRQSGGINLGPNEIIRVTTEQQGLEGLECLGVGEHGHVYVNTHKQVLKIWPKILADVKKALAVKKLD